MTAVAPAPPANNEPPAESAPVADGVVHRIAFVALLVGTAVLYLWNLGMNRYANDFYAAAEQAGSQSWKAWFFGASDAGNSITVDKPPVSLWISGIAVRVFGLNSWSILVPQALMGVASVALVYLIARRIAGPNAGLLAGVVLALTPVAALMFRFNNPDALLVLLLLGAAWATIAILDDGRVRWAVLAGGLIGIAFLTKQLQALLIVPAIGVVYLAFGPPAWKTRIVHLLAAAAAMIVGAGWWVLAVSLWPKDSRPYIGGTEHNSIIELTIGYNGLGRLTGNESSGLGGGADGPRPSGDGPMGALFGGQTGILRMFSNLVGGQVGWLIPAALILGVVAIALRGRSPRIDLERSTVVFAWLWLLSNGVLMSYMAGIFHPYYTLALVPPIALLVGIGGVRSWQARETLWVRGALIVTAAITGYLAWVILDRTSDFQGWLRWVVVALTVLLVLALVAEKFTAGTFTNGRITSRAMVAIAVIVGLAGPTAYTINTVATSRTGGLAAAGPQRSPLDAFGGGRGGRGGMPGSSVPGGSMPAGATGSPMTPAEMKAAATALRRSFTGEPPPRAVTELLARGAQNRRWAAAAVSALAASGYQLALERPVMPVGGFSGGDPSPTLAQFQRYVAQGDIGWFIGGGGFMMRGNGTAAQIAAWVAKNYRAQTIDGVTIYNLQDSSTR
ncbi:glycosyltransferase family 39 protein [Williamsia phyllosphaerae]|uniref:Glycosyltransferase n=1 Tax=Williamsia phyllosphaerae TaxID=885042 RepID=A0ABQ1V306_9NOCA|nr:glycosyltransferase family 39 protein [Williamsia phyllosphaerae]GGF35192.1 putative glycosyltransferase [Williamsia phyllosphaerae]